MSQNRPSGPAWSQVPLLFSTELLQERTCSPDVQQQHSSTQMFPCDGHIVTLRSLVWVAHWCCIPGAQLGSFHSLLCPKSPKHFVYPAALTQLRALLWEDTEEMCNNETEWERDSPQKIVEGIQQREYFLLNKKWYELFGCMQKAAKSLQWPWTLQSRVGGTENNQKLQI